MIRLSILTISDKGSRGERKDLSGPAIEEKLKGIGAEVVRYEIVPDEQDVIAEHLSDWADSGDIDLLVTTGGTGLAPRDVTPEATLSVVERLVPGLPELMRFEGMKKTPNACLSRAVAGIRGQTLIVNLPGSPRAVIDSLEAILVALPHAIATVRGEVGDHPEATLND